MHCLGRRKARGLQLRTILSDAAHHPQGILAGDHFEIQLFELQGSRTETRTFYLPEASALHRHIHLLKEG